MNEKENLRKANDREVKERFNALTQHDKKLALSCMTTNDLLEELSFRLKTLEEIAKSLDMLGKHITVKNDEVNWEAKI